MNPTCSHGERVYREGTGKNGKPYKAWFCGSPRGTPDQCEVEWATSAPAQAPTAPNQATELLSSIDSKLTIVVELLREIALKDNPIR